MYGCLQFMSFIFLWLLTKNVINSISPQKNPSQWRITPWKPKESFLTPTYRQGSSFTMVVIKLSLIGALFISTHALSVLSMIGMITRYDNITSPYPILSLSMAFTFIHIFSFTSCIACRFSVFFCKFSGKKDFFPDASRVWNRNNPLKKDLNAGNTLDGAYGKI